MEPSNIDPMLLSLAVAAEKNKFTYLTLLVNGTIVKGRLTSKQFYLSGIQNSLPVDDEINSLISESSKLIAYLHLSDVVIHQSVQMQFLRIQTSSVDGFSIDN